MENLGLNTDVAVGERIFNIQSSFSESSKCIVSQVFNEGTQVDTRELSAQDLSVDEIQNRMNELHEELITEMEVLYYIYEKVKTVRHATSSNKLGLVFLKKNLFKEAKEQFKLAIDIDPSYAEVFVNLARTLLIEDLFDEAIEVLSSGERAGPNFADIQNYLGIAYLYRENFDLAVTHLENAIRLNQNYIGAYYHLGMAHLAQALSNNRSVNPEQEKKALQYLSTASERMVNRQFPNYQKVMNSVYSKAYREAVDTFFQSKPRDFLEQVQNIENDFYLKFMYGGKGKDDTFISDYVDKLQEMIREHPDYADLRNSLGIANLIQCRNLFLKSLEEFRTALKINSQFHKADKNLKLAENDGKGFLILLRAILK